MFAALPVTLIGCSGTSIHINDNDKLALFNTNVYVSNISSSSYKKPRVYDSSNDYMPPHYGIMPSGSFASGAAFGALSYIAHEAAKSAEQSEFEKK